MPPTDIYIYIYIYIYVYIYIWELNFHMYLFECSFIVFHYVHLVYVFVDLQANDKE